MPTNPFKNFKKDLASPADQHFIITPVNGVDLPITPRVLKVLTTGNLSIRDKNGVIITYPVFAGDTFTFSALGVESTGTTATVVGWI